MLIHKTQIPQSETIFTPESHLSSMKRKAGIMKAKMLGYQFSKWTAIIVVTVGLLGAGSFQVLASTNHHGNNQPNKSVNKINKTVKAKAGNKNNYGNSNSHANVDNSVRVNTGGGNGGGGTNPSISRNNGNNHKNNNNGGGNNKKVVRKDVTRKTVDNSYTDNSYTDNSYTENTTDIDVNQKTTYTETCGDCYNSNEEYTTYNNTKSDYHRPPTQHKSYDTTNNNYNENEDYNYNDNRSYDRNDIRVINNNDNQNNNDNRQYMDVSFPSYYEDY